MEKRLIDILCVGELLVDFITTEFAETLDAAKTFERIPGGSPANLCMNMARLGNTAYLAAAVGKDEMGTILLRYVEKTGVHTAHIAQVDAPTTLILVTRSAEVSNFQAYRSADKMLTSRQIPFGKLPEISYFHTTCFALSLEPARTVIMEAAERAQRNGCKLSIDANYAPKIWPNQAEAQRVVTEYCRMGAIVKFSDVDWQRLYGNQHTPEQAIEHLLMSGASEVCFTLGDKGCWVATDDERHFLPARSVEVKDTTGAGDAFWSGYLTARLDNKSILHSAMAGRKLAEIKLGVFGPLPMKVDRSAIYIDLED